VIQNVTLQPDAGVLTITGTGLGADLIVTVDGQRVTLLPGATPTQVDVQAPATILNAPGAYRLTVVDPASQIGDAFVVVSQAATIPVGGAALGGSSRGTRTTTSAPTRDTTERATGLVVQRPVYGAVSPALIENNCNTAIGLLAFASNTVGCRNTALGQEALAFNTTGSDNTASGRDALRSNTTGFNNTATGVSALRSNTTGTFNVASGTHALASNTTGFYNTSDGVESLLYNTTGSQNTAVGLWALLANSTGSANTAVGYRSGAAATTGWSNIFIGSGVAGTAADANTIRIGLPYDGASGGQNRAFIAGIFGTPLTGAAYNVYIDANGQLGTAPMTNGGGFLPMAHSEQQITDLREQLRDQHDVIADLRARLAKLEALVASAARAK
jgi:hypothetical protein